MFSQRRHLQTQRERKGATPHAIHRRRGAGRLACFDSAGPGAPEVLPPRGPLRAPLGPMAALFLATPPPTPPCPQGCASTKRGEQVEVWEPTTSPRPPGPALPGPPRSPTARLKGWTQAPGGAGQRGPGHRTVLGVCFYELTLFRLLERGRRRPCQEGGRGSWAPILQESGRSKGGAVGNRMS